MGRYALLIAAGEYEDVTLARLRAPGQDVNRLAAILEAPDVGGFDAVTVLQDTSDDQLRIAIEEILTERLRDDLVLVYFSCHGIVDGRHRLYFATTNTRHTRPAATAVSRTFVNEQLEACIASAKVLILDCCYSGAFAEGFKSAPKAALEGQVGRGYVVLAASDAYEYAYEADSITDAAPRASVFTDVLIEGLGSGAADLDGDQRIGVDELFRYVQQGVQRRSVNQTPRFWANDAELNIYLAKAGQPRAMSTLAGTAPLAPEASTGEAAPEVRPSNYNRNQVIVARGLRAASDRIRLMLGPLGRRVLVEDETGQLVEAADAHTFATVYRPEDPRDRLGASYAAKIVEQAHQHAGDGATTAVVLAQAMVEGAVAALRAGAHPMALASGIEVGVARAVKALPPQARDVETKEQINAFAAMAARDEDAGQIIAEAFDKVGDKGVIIIEESNTFGLEVELTEGIRFDRGYISPHFVTNPGRKECVLEDLHVILVNSKISAIDDLLPAMGKVVESGKSLLVIAEDVDGGALATMVVNKTKDLFKSAAVRAPGFGAHRQGILEDIAILTGGHVILTDQLAEANLDMFGHIRKVIITKEETVLIDCSGDPEKIAARAHQIRTEIERAHSNDERAKLSERLAKLAGGVAVIRIGASTEAELTELKTRCEMAVRASRIAIMEGLMPGGCTSLRAIAQAVSKNAEGTDRGAGVKIVADSLETPYIQILSNAGMPDLGPAGANIDVLAGVQADLFATNIFDSVGVLRSALEAAKNATIRFLKVA